MTPRQADVCEVHHTRSVHRIGVGILLLLIVTIALGAGSVSVV
jgi:hypothetical protein